MNRLSLLLPGGSEATVFDIILQSQFSDTITPAFNYVFHHVWRLMDVHTHIHRETPQYCLSAQVLLPNFPILAPLVGLKHELLALLLVQTQSRYLSSSNATLQEYMFGWRRKEAEFTKASPANAGASSGTSVADAANSTNDGSAGLSTRSMLVSLAAEVGWPYLRGLLMDVHAEEAELEANGPGSETTSASESDAETDSDASTSSVSSRSQSGSTSALRSKLASISAFVIRYIPYGVAAVETARLFQLVRFAAGLSKYPSIGHALARLTLVKASSAGGSPPARISRPVQVFEAVMTGVR
jgi:hypothetical protein